MRSMCLCGPKEDKETEHITRPSSSTVVACGCCSYMDNGDQGKNSWEKIINLANLFFMLGYPQILNCTSLKKKKHF